MSKKTKKRSVLVLAACPYPAPQGSQAYISECIKVYQAKGHRVELCTYGYGIGDAPDGLVVHRAGNIPLAKRTAAGPSWAKPIQDWRLLAKLKSLLESETYDVIDAHNYEALLVALASGFRPIIYHAHNALADELPHYRGFGKIGRSIGAALDERLPSMADIVVAPHDRLKAYLIEKGCAKTQIKSITPSIDPKPFVHKKEYTDAPVVLYAGNLDGYQNTDLLESTMRAVQAQRPETRCIVATNAVTKLPYAEVIPIPDQAALRSVLEMDAVFVCPRTSWSGYPIKLLNAMAAGLPVVACESAAHPVRHNQTGFVVPDEAPDQFLAQTLHLLDDSSLRKQLGNAAKRRSTQLYSENAMMCKIMEGISG